MGLIGCVYSTLAFFCFLVYGATVTLHLLAWHKSDADIGLFRNNRSSLWDLYTSKIISTTTIYWTWIVVYAYQLVFHLYSLTLPARNRKIANALYESVTSWMLLCLIFGYSLLVAWVFIWDRFVFIQYSNVCILGAVVFIIVGLIACTRTVHIYTSDLERGSPYDLWMVRLLIQNSLSLLCSWCAILVFYLGSVIVQIYVSLSNEQTDYMFLGLMAGYIIVWFSVDMCCSLRSLAYVFTPYIIWAVICVMAVFSRKDGDRMVFIISIVIAAVIGVIILIKISVTIGHARSHARIRKLTDTLPGYTDSQLGGRSAVSSDGLGLDNRSGSIKTDRFDF